LGSLLNTWM